MAQVVDEFDNGVIVYQVSDEPHIVSNIYCERPYCSADSRRFLYARQVEEGRFGWEYVLCEFETWETEMVGKGALSVSTSYNDDTYYLAPKGDTGSAMMRLDLGTGETEVVVEFPDEVPRMGHPTISPDRRYIAWHCVISYQPQVFGVEVTDTATGKREMVHEDPYVCNAHLQFHPLRNDLLLVQHNRGCEFTPKGERLRLVGDEGATLFLLGAQSGQVTRLPVGKPHTTPITGHEAWVGISEEIILTVRPDGDYSPEKGNILIIEPDRSVRQIGAGWRMNHIGTTPCGRYFHADGSRNGEIIVGSPRTGRTVFICNSYTSYGERGFGQQSHPHAYLTNDFQWVVFNSDRTERPQVYAARVPAGLLEQVE